MLRNSGGTKDTPHVGRHAAQLRGIPPKARFYVHKTRAHLGYYDEHVILTGWLCQRRCVQPIEMNDLQQTYDRIIRPIEDRMIRSIWRIVRNPQDAEDAMQDALLTVLKRWDRISRHAKPPIARTENLY